ncbi:ESPR-type extended signal peptide-containing protein [uncultured Megasphaera sp.]|uniref:ESPR-type extended signal peptide-containing protein n=1 Tax=uncultured Megasphaera sp. TaxID=165188 RepID=UPI0025981528|nr:ESPR-type extended signal peptide-containing protein [uncultured Megasphaera sp.]
MNHWYRVIWSHVKHGYIVVSELAKRDGKSFCHAGKGRLTALVLAALVSLGSGVYAAEPPAATILTADQQAVYNAVLQELAKNEVNNIYGIHYISVRGTSKYSHDTNFDNDGAKKPEGIAIGENAKSEGWSAIAIGSEANSAGGWDIVIGKQAKSTGKQLGTAIGYQASVSGNRGIALGANTNVSGQTGIAIGGEAKSTGSRAIAIAERAESSGDWGMAIGAHAKNTAQLGMALGPQATVSGEGGISFGNWANAAGKNALSIGASASSLAMSGIAVGTISSVAATAARGIAIGDGAYVGPVTDKHKGTAMPKPGDSWSPSMPFQPTDDDTNPEKSKKTPQENSLAIGMRAGAFGYQNVAIGAAAEAHDTNSTAVGVAAVARGHHSTALGKQARTYGQETTSVGHWADTRDEFATALGAKSIAYKKGATALGSNARAYDANSVAIGANSIAKEAVDGKALYTNEEIKAAAGIVSVGHPDYKVGDKEVKANYRRIVNVAGGISDHDAVNVAQLKALAMLPMNMYSGGTVANNTYTPGNTNWSMPLNEFRMDFGDGLKATQVTDKDGKKYTLVTLDKESLKGDPAFKGDKGESGQAGKDGTNGKSAYQVWKELQNPDGSKPNEHKTEQDFFTSLKGKDGKDGKNGVAAAVTVKASEKGNNIQEAKFVITPQKPEMTFVGDRNIKTLIEKDNTVKIALQDTITAKTIKVGDKVTITKEGATFDKVAIAGKQGTITGLTNTTWDTTRIVSGRAATEAQVQQATQTMQRQMVNDMNGIAAGNAALAGLHPLAYDDRDKWNLSAAIGKYRGADAVAFGAFYRPNETTQVSLSGAFGTGRHMLMNAGVAWKVGGGSLPGSSKMAMARQLAAQQWEIEQLRRKDRERDKEMAAMKEREAQLWKEVALLKSKT